jgi:hypothetical protein
MLDHAAHAMCNCCTRHVQLQHTPCATAAHAMCNCCTRQVQLQYTPCAPGALSHTGSAARQRQARGPRLGNGLVRGQRDEAEAVNGGRGSDCHVPKVDSFGCNYQSARGGWHYRRQASKQASRQAFKGRQGGAAIKAPKAGRQCHMPHATSSSASARGPKRLLGARPRLRTPVPWAKDAFAPQLAMHACCSWLCMHVAAMQAALMPVA